MMINIQIKGIDLIRRRKKRKDDKGLYEKNKIK